MSMHDDNFTDQYEIDKIDKQNTIIQSIGLVQLIIVVLFACVGFFTNNQMIPWWGFLLSGLIAVIMLKVDDYS